jgi:hypothetical protein
MTVLKYAKLLWHVLFYMRATLGISVSAKNNLRIFENKVPRRMTGPKREKVKIRMHRKNHTMRNFITCALHQILLG